MLDTIPPGRLTSRCALIVSNETSSANYQYGGRWLSVPLDKAVLLGSCPRFISLQNPEFTARTFLCHDRLESRFHGRRFCRYSCLLVSIYLAPVRDRYPGGGMSAFLMGDFQACVFSEWLSLCDRIKGQTISWPQSQLKTGFRSRCLPYSCRADYWNQPAAWVLWLSIQESAR